MFDFLTRNKVFETVDIDKKNHVMQVFNENHIDYVIRKNDLHHRSALDNMKMGEMMVKPKYVYVFWVKKNQSASASALIKVSKGR